MKPLKHNRQLVAAGLLIGIGMGGFLDGILFHQILQIHNMLSAKFPKTSITNMEINMFWDGLFHAFTWLSTALGIGLLWRTARHPEANWSGRVFVGAQLTGWGLFNLIEGIIDHHLLHLHHVVERLGVSTYDYAFIGSGVALIISGVLLIRSGSSRTV